jgi:hypothetical protein
LSTILYQLQVIVKQFSKFFILIFKSRFCFEMGFTDQPWPMWNSLCIPVWLRTHDPSASAC